MVRPARTAIEAWESADTEFGTGAERTSELSYWWHPPGTLTKLSRPRCTAANARHGAVRKPTQVSKVCCRRSTLTVCRALRGARIERSERGWRVNFGVLPVICKLRKQWYEDQSICGEARRCTGGPDRLAAPTEHRGDMRIHRGRARQACSRSWRACVRTSSVNMSATIPAS